MATESKKRSLAKSISWRFTATVTTVILAYLFFGNMQAALSLGVVESLLKIGLFYGHERVWARIRVV